MQGGHSCHSHMFYLWLVESVEHRTPRYKESTAPHFSNIQEEGEPCPGGWLTLLTPK